LVVLRAPADPFASSSAAFRQSFAVIGLDRRTFTSKLPFMLGTQKRRAANRRPSSVMS